MLLFTRALPPPHPSFPPPLQKEVEHWWAVYEGRLAPQRLPSARQLSAGLDDLLGLSLRPASALGAAEEAARVTPTLTSRAGTPTPFGPGGALERAGSLGF